MLFENILRNINYEKLSCYKSTHDYPEDCIPTNSRPPAGAKARKADFEQINPNLYAEEAKIAAFRIERNLIYPYIQALHFIFFESIGNSEEFDVKWYDVPDEWKLNCGANSINIDVHKKENTDDMLFKVTFFVTTGTIQIQGNAKDSFVNEIFPRLKQLAVKHDKLRKINANHINNEVSNENIPSIETPNIIITDVDETSVKKPIGDFVAPENCDKAETKKSNKNKTSNENIGVQSGTINPKGSENNLHENRGIDKLEGNLVDMTDKIYTQLSRKIALKFNDINEHLKESQQQEEYLRKSVSDINTILADLKERCENSDRKQVTSDQQKEQELRQLGESVFKLQKNKQ